MNTTLQTCPDVGAWRAWMDGENDLNEDHLTDCPGCRQVVAELRQDAAGARAGLAALAPSQVPSSADVAVARERLDWRRAQQQRAPTRVDRQPARAFAARVSTPLRIAAGGLAAALVLAAVVAFTPEGGSAAAAFLAQFRSQQVSAIEITPQSQADIMRSMNALGNLGSVETPATGGATTSGEIARAQLQQAHTATPAEATRTVGFALLAPDPKTLPPGVNTTPTIRVSSAQQVRFTFDRNKAQAYYRSTGHPEVSMPDKFDGATLSVSIPAAAVLTYGSTATTSRNELIIVEAGDLLVDVQGKVSLPEMRDFLLSLPGLPAPVVSQLKQIQNWNDTLPIPVPVDQVNWKPITVNGSQGLLLNDNSGIGSAAVWHANGHLLAVAGSLKAKDLTPVAESLAVR